ncbi:MAG TPA: ATP-binding protein [Actinopolymorphaceae bacterium]
MREWLWREDRVRALLDGHREGLLFLSGRAPNQARFRSAFDPLVLLAAPVALTVERLATRTNNDFGKDPAELAKVLADKREVEPMLARAATACLETNVPVDEVVRALLELVATPHHGAI